MPHYPHHAPAATSPRRFWSALLLFAAIALFFLREEHQAHLLGALPYLIVLLCPLAAMAGATSAPDPKRKPGMDHKTPTCGLRP
ncbi:DUF2933 domain-containing protein [Pseudomonas sp.]|uniref:DUF2933 domain-containing protein n=1 Tax=Pseudomonas sp. TaxID=306 RepID=UPI00299F1D27|nr:DUF2933 domain-containing protein [Pseudomonas sp.]MDX1370074.1 DUF2933 domain-containing protein [Pseudomonas sp.]